MNELNQRILDLLPKKMMNGDDKIHTNYVQNNISGYNRAIDDVITALSKHEVCLVPSEKEIQSAIYTSLKGIMKSESTGKTWTLWLHKDEVSVISKAIRTLLLGKSEKG